jgi:hypothetical protein
MTIGRSLLALGLLLFGPIVVSAGNLGARGADWATARRDSSRQAPDPASTPEAVVQVYAARAWGWRGAVAVHTWVAVKPSNARKYTRYEVIGWGVHGGAAAIRLDRFAADAYWHGSAPELLVDRRGGAEVDQLIERVEAAVRSYPYPNEYRTWPGPNSNTFTAHIGREVPELRLVMPSTAIGKDFLPGGAVAALTPSGTGAQLSFYGLVGVLAGWDEGVELNILGLSLGVDPVGLALKLPGIGRVGLPRTPS